MLLCLTPSLLQNECNQGGNVISEMRFDDIQCSHIRSWNAFRPYGSFISGGIGNGKNSDHWGVNARREINRTDQNHRLYIEMASEI